MNLLILNLLLVPHEDTSHCCEQPPSGGVLALQSAPYAPNQGPPGPLGVQVGVKLADLTGTPESLSRHEAAVVRKYREQTLPLLTGPRRLCDTGTWPLETGQQQAHAPFQPRHILKLSSAPLDRPPGCSEAPQPDRIHTDLTDRTTGHRVEHDSRYSDKFTKIGQK